MAKIDYPKAIRSLELSYNLLPKKPEALSKSDLKTLGEACSLYLKFYELFVGASIDPRIIDAYSFQKFVIDTEIENLINKFREAEEAEKEEQKKPKEQEASIPPELESLVAEYRQNQALLESEEIKASSQKSVAAQVKIAIAHRKIVNRALANRDRRDAALVALGSPKSESATEALADSYYVTKKIAFTYRGFSKLSPQLQNQIISSAVEFKLVGVSDINTAIQASALQVDISSLSDSDGDNLATIPGGFVSTIYQEAVALDKQEIAYQAQISANEEKIIDLEKQGKIEEARLLAEENLHLLASIEGQSVRFADKATKLTESYKDFEKNRDAKYSQIEETDRDFRDKITSANGTITSIHNNLERNGVKGHIYTAMDDVALLEQAIRRDMPGVLRSNAGYEAEYAAALINNPKTQNPNLSPQAILLYGKDLTPKLLAKARKFALDNPDSALGKLFKTHKGLFDSAGSQLRKIADSPLGKEISKATTGIGKVFRIISNPLGALKSWAGRKAGEQLVRLAVKHLGSNALIKGAEMLIKNGLKATVKKLIVQVVAKTVVKIAVKLGIKLTVEAALQALNAIPGLGIVAAILFDIAWEVIEKTIGFAKKVFDSASIALYGEKVKARDLLAIPVAGAATVVGGVVTFFGALGTATVAAASSAAAIAAAGIAIGVFFYITSIAVAPLLSTLVNLQSTPGLGKATGCANIEGTFVSQRDPAWANVLCPSCTSADKCDIGGSGCGSASTTMILKSFGIDEDVVNIWNIMNNNGAYVYKPDAATHPYTSCPSSDEGNIQILTDNNLIVTDIGDNMEEANNVLNSCGLIFTLGQLYVDCPDQVGGCGHYIVITGINGDQFTANDPWSGEQYVHTDSSFKISKMWAVVPNK